jgi:UDP-GlcNAc:undecaprenyl-phosphate GlcNAc-1-phosphate transferase
LRRGKPMTLHSTLLVVTGFAMLIAWVVQLVRRDRLYSGYGAMLIVTFGAPIFDTTFVTLTRRLAHRPISVGGRDHTSHRLVRLGLSERRAVLLLYLVSIAAGIVAYSSYQLGLSYGVILISFLIFGFGVLGVYLSRVEVYEGAVPPATDGLVRLVTDFQYKRQVITLLIDLVLIVLAYYTAYLLRFEDQFRDFEQLFVRSLPLSWSAT